MDHDFPMQSLVKMVNGLRTIKHWKLRLIYMLTQVIIFQLCTAFVF